MSSFEIPHNCHEYLSTYRQCILQLSNAYYLLVSSSHLIHSVAYFFLAFHAIMSAGLVKYIEIGNNKILSTCNMTLLLYVDVDFNPACVV